MVKITRRKRRPPILTPSSIPCLRRLATLNLTEGCSFGCTYCYIQGYPNYPGKDTIILFENTADVLREELGRKRRRPKRVYFSPSSDAFQDIPEVQEVAFQAISVLLEKDIEVSFLTKGFLADRILALFAQHPRGVFAQVGISTLDEQICHDFEPGAAPPERRIQTIRKLKRIGVETTARLDPLIPDLTDTQEKLSPLLAALREAGIDRAAASYLFLRHSLARPLSEQLGAWGIHPTTVGAWAYQEFREGCGGGRMIDMQDRKQRFQRLAEAGRENGIAIRPCGCKNPDLEAGTCDISGPASRSEQEQPMRGILRFPANA